jgi:hypothetical protein
LNACGRSRSVSGVSHSVQHKIAADDGICAVNQDGLIAAVRNETNQYLKKQAVEIRKLGVEKVSAVAKEGFAGDEIIAIGHNTPDGLIAMCSHRRSV